MRYLSSSLRLCLLVFTFPCLQAQEQTSTTTRDTQCVLHVAGESDTSLTEDTCGLPGIPHALLYRNVANAVVADGKRYGFPADLVNYVFGMPPSRHQFALRPWEFRKSYAEEDLSGAKRRLPAHDQAAPVVAFDMPGMGIQFYDADLIRALVSTDLFPYQMHIRTMTVNHQKSEFIQLDKASAQLTKDCLGEISMDETTANSKHLGCTATLKKYKSEETGQDEPRVRGSMSFLNSYANESTKPADSNLLLLLANLPTKESGPIILELEKPCLNVPATSCDLSLKLTIPEYSGSDYSELSVTGVVEQPGVTVDKCGPAALDENAIADEVKPRQGCVGTNFDWSLHGDVLHGRKERYQRLKIRISTTTSTVIAPALKITLEGTPQPFLLGVFGKKPNSTWCYPHACSGPPK